MEEWSKLSLKRQPYKIVKHIQTICQQFANKLFECVFGHLWDWCLKSYLGCQVLFGEFCWV